MYSCCFLKFQYLKLLSFVHDYTKLDNEGRTCLVSGHYIYKSISELKMIAFAIVNRYYYLFKRFMTFKI
jgi:hypothetical protein